MNTVKLSFNGYEATVIRPENPNGKWIWKTEFLYAFDASEKALCEMGYTRVYYQISDKYGSYEAVRLMHKFYHFIVKEFNLDKKCVLFGFSRGGLYAFNFAMSYPEYVEKIYLDAPVLDMRSWPPKGSREREEVYQEYTLTEETLEIFKGHPIENLKEFFELNIPLLLVAGGSDEVVPFEENSGKMIEYCKNNNIDIISIVKPECKHHPHSLENVQPIIDFIEQ
ncbi:MAG: prolyl oligopeptidase family serine peptidase [Clostridia bacterium]|nr:prolyl oligopeptidase family serine peptidase [Clostridia bacterium]MBQ7789601.1 prolyl oligopeptidase family serine peptidase [Clostridia bacterium]